MIAHDRPVAIEARGLSKSFSIPVPRKQHSLRDRLRHPLLTARTQDLKVLEDISFDVYQGEFFGIVGRNGSGKSTLLKLLASVYGSDSGRIRIAGRLAPFLELGVGFNPQLPAYENVILNGVMMGLTPAQAKAGYESVIDFAGLKDYTELRLKNYSSGMKVRLAFAVMVQVDADVLLMDEVLAVGDTEFQQKCEATFRRMQAEGRTIVLVTHSMPTINAYCDRALLVHEGRIAAIGDPVEVSNRYLEVNMQAAATNADGHMSAYAARWARTLADPPVRIAYCRLVDAEGNPTRTIAASDPITVEATIEIERPIEGPGFQFRIDDLQGQILFSGGPADLGLNPDQIVRGYTFTVKATIENRFAGGRYIFSCGVPQRLADGSTEPATAITAFPFNVEGNESEGLLRLDSAVTLTEAARSS